MSYHREPYNPDAPHYAALMRWALSPQRNADWHNTLHTDGRVVLRYRGRDTISILRVEGGQALLEVSTRDGHRRLSVWLPEDDAYAILAEGRAPDDLLATLNAPRTPVNRPAHKGRHI